jgi:hypothetical protein
MEIVSYIILAAGIAFFIWQKRRDWWKSSLQPLHLPPAEVNPATKGGDGYFDQGRAYLVSGLTVAAFGGAAITISLTSWEGAKYAPLVVGLIFGAWGAYVMNGIRKDIDVLNRHEREQRTLLAVLRSDPAGDLPLPTLKAYKPGHRFVLGTFYDFAEETDIPVGSGVAWDPIKAHEARDRIRPRLVKLSQMPESEWFKVGRAQKV